MIRSKWSKFKEQGVHLFFFFNGVIVIFVLIGIFVLLIQKSYPAFHKLGFSTFFFDTNWNPAGYDSSSYGILAMIVSTFMVTVGSLIIAIPLGVGTACYLSDIASPKVREIMKPIIELLASIPSVIIGFLGIVLVNPIIAKCFGLTNGLNAINGAVLLAVMALPTIISLSEDALNSTPESYNQASLALGATKWQTLVCVKIPAAISGILAACMLGMGRAIGETMTVLMATGCAPAMPINFFDSVRTMSSTIAIELGEVAYDTTHYYVLFVVGLVLFLMTFLVNMVSDIILHRYERKQRG